MKSDLESCLVKTDEVDALLGIWSARKEVRLSVMFSEIPIALKINSAIA